MEIGCVHEAQLECDHAMFVTILIYILLLIWEDKVNRLLSYYSQLENLVRMG